MPLASGPGRRAKSKAVWQHPRMIFALLLTLASTPLPIQGEVQEAVFDESSQAFALLVRRGGHQELVRVDKKGQTVGSRSVIRRDALALTACGPRGILVVDGQGIRSEDGTRLIDAAPIFSGGDVDEVRFLSLCDGKGEIRLPTVKGIRVLGAGATSAHELSFRPVMRSYGSRSSAGLPRAYAAAWTTYLPQMYDVNVDADPALEFVLVDETRIFIFDRAKNGTLGRAPTRVVRHRHAFSKGLSAGASSRVLLADVDGDGRAEAIVTQFESVFSKKTEAAVVDLSGTASKTTRTRTLFAHDGFSVILGVAQKRVYFAHLNTGAMALTGAIVSGEVSVDVRSIALGEEDGTSHATATLAVDVPRAKLLGTLPRWLAPAAASTPVVGLRLDQRLVLRAGLALEQKTDVPLKVDRLLPVGDRLLVVAQARRRSLVSVIDLPLATARARR